VSHNNWRLNDHAGEGEFGIVHKALFHGTLVAAKILKGSSAIALGDFRSEIEVLRKVHHPNAVQFIGACTKQEPYILVTGICLFHSSQSQGRTSLTPCARCCQLHGIVMGTLNILAWCRAHGRGLTVRCHAIGKAIHSEKGHGACCGYCTRTCLLAR
jgi:serine/threonine protein kinase